MIEIIKAFVPGKTTRTTRLKGKYYERNGSCNRCGKCCTNIYLVHSDHALESVEAFEALKPQYPEYRHFKPIGATEHGIQFQCIHLTEANTCGIYAKRPQFCRNYPSEKSILLGGTLAEGCGYSFNLLRSFQQVLTDTAQQKRLKNPGKLLQ